MGPDQNDWTYPGLPYLEQCLGEQRISLET